MNQGLQWTGCVKRVFVMRADCLVHLYAHVSYVRLWRMCLLCVVSQNIQNVCEFRKFCCSVLSERCNHKMWLYGIIRFLTYSVRMLLLCQQWQLPENTLLSFFHALRSVVSFCWFLSADRFDYTQVWLVCARVVCMHFSWFPSLSVSCYCISIRVFVDRWQCGW